MLEITELEVYSDLIFQLIIIGLWWLYGEGNLYELRQ